MNGIILCGFKSNCQKLKLLKKNKNKILTPPSVQNNNYKLIIQLDLMHTWIRGNYRICPATFTFGRGDN